MFSQKTLQVIQNLQTFTKDFDSLTRQSHADRRVNFYIRTIFGWTVSCASLVAVASSEILSPIMICTSFAMPVILSSMHVYRWGICKLNPYRFVDKMIELQSVNMLKRQNSYPEIQKLSFFHIMALIKFFVGVSNLSGDNTPDLELEFLFDIQTQDGQNDFVKHLEKSTELLVTLIKLGANLKDFPSVEDKFVQRIVLNDRTSLQWQTAKFINEHDLYSDAVKKGVEITQPAIDILQANSQLYLVKHSGKRKQLVIEETALVVKYQK